MKRVLMAVVVALAGGCTSGHVYMRPGALNRIHRVTLKLVTGGSARSSTLSALGGPNVLAGSSTSMDSEDQAQLALGRVEGMLSEHDFPVVRDGQVDANAELAIGTIRFNPFVGWVADRVRLVFRDPDSGEAVASFEYSNAGAPVDALLSELERQFHAVRTPAPAETPKRRGR